MGYLNARPQNIFIRLCVYDKGSDDIYSEFFAASYVKRNYESVISIRFMIFLLNQNLHSHTVHINNDHILLFFSLVCVDCYTVHWLIVCTYTRGVDNSYASENMIEKVIC